MTFFMVLKKVKVSVFREIHMRCPLTFTALFRPPFLLLSSVLFTFFAAIVDLARISLHKDNSILVQREVDGLTHALAEAREALSSIASGLRFLYFWAFVAQAPLCEQSSASFLRLHSGSWLHWGLTGAVLRWSTLLASVSIFILQTLWRLVQSLRKFGPVYDVENAFEIMTSGVFIIKLILNAMIVEEPCRRQTLWQYSMALSALLINMGLGIGNLLDCKLFLQKYATGLATDLLYKVSFSETSLGRLLLATELYILIVSSMVFTFYSRKSTATPSPLPDKRASSFYGLHVSKYDADIGLAGEDDANAAGSSRPSGQRALSWFSWAGNVARSSSSQLRPSIENGRRPRSEEAAERGVTLSPSEKNVLFAVPDDIQRSSVNSSTTDPITRGISEGFSSSTTQLPTDSVYDDGKPFAPTAAARTASPDSPTLGPDGSRKPNQPSDRSFTSSRQSGYESLLREQDQLERSIAALKTMFEQGSSGEGQRNGSPDTAFQPSRRSKLRESSTTAYGPTSASNRSDFSLSVFPEPPEVQITENLRRIRPLSSSTSALTPTQISYDIGGRSFPVSTSGIDDVAVLALGGMESAGTHYDVTSFIGGALAMFPLWDACD